MKKMKKLSSGMTLVEVVISMGIFSTMTLGITMAFSAALQYNARNIRRDNELNQQQTSIEKSTATGVKVYGSSLNARTIQYAHEGTVEKEIENVTEYSALPSSYNGSTFGFQIKTFSSVPLGSASTVNDKSQSQYKITFTNLSPYAADVRITTTGGVIYEGDAATGYRHSSTLYKRSVDGYDENADTIEDADGNQTAPSGFVIGYENPNDCVMTMRVYCNGSIVSEFNIDNDSLKSFSAPDGAASITLNSSGTAVSISYE